MTLFCLIYPSRTLADAYDPIACMNESLGIRDIKQRIKEQISIKLQDYPSPQSGNPDKAWYYIAPLLLDGKNHVQLWLSGSDKLTAYDSEEEKTKKQKGFTAHLDALKTLYYQFLENAESTLGKRPDDLLDVLADMAIASPAVCVYRTYRKYINDQESIPLYYPSQVAKKAVNIICYLSISILLIHRDYR